MTLLIDDLMSYTVTGIHQSDQSVDLSHAVVQATQNLELQIERCGATIVVEELPTIVSNEIQIIRVFQNLISNAMKYRSANPVRVEIGAERDGSNWELSVKDNGLGISQEDQASVFLAFKRLGKIDVPGSGLGLAVCKKIVEGLGGHIWVRSEFGSGSTFMFSVRA